MSVKTRRMARPKRPKPLRDSDDSNEAVGMRVRQVRNAEGWTQQQFADFLKISVSSLSYIEAGKRGLDPHHATRIFDKWAVDHTWLYIGYEGGLSKETRDWVKRGLSSSSDPASRSA